MATFAEIKNAADNTDNVRKVLEAVAFLAPMSAAVIDSLTDETGALVALPNDYLPVGLVTRDGYTFGGDTETTAVDALGYASPVREDIESYTRTVSFTAYEVYKRNLLELAYGMDLSEATVGDNGEIVFDRPTLPNKTFYRLIVIGKDGSGANEIYRAKLFPKVSITSIPEEVWGTDALSFSVTLSTYVDEEEGTQEREFIAGPGVVPADLGFGAGEGEGEGGE